MNNLNSPWNFDKQIATARKKNSIFDTLKYNGNGDSKETTGYASTDLSFISIPIFDKIQEGTCVHYSNAVKISNLTKEHQTFALKYINISNYENEEEHNGTTKTTNEDFNAKVGKENVIITSKLVFMIPYCDPETFTSELLCSRKYIQCTGDDFEIWEDGKLRSNGEPWVRRNTQTMRISYGVSIPQTAINIGPSITLQFECNEVRPYANPEHAKYLNIFKIKKQDLPSRNENWDRIFIFERTKEDICKIDRVLKIKYLVFIKKCKEGVIQQWILLSILDGTIAPWILNGTINYIVRSKLADQNSRRKLIKDMYDDIHEPKFLQSCYF